MRESPTPHAAERQEPDVPVPLPLRGAAHARRGDRAAAPSTATTPRCSPAARASCRCSSCASPSPALLVDINNLPGLDHHREDADGTLRVGALCRHADLERSTLLPGTHPMMAAAAPLVADPIVRNRGTLVGSLCHADPQGDWAAVMIALGGSVVAQGPAGGARSRWREFVTGPVPERAAARRDRGRGGRPGRAGHARPAATSSWSAASATSRRPGVAVALERSAAPVTRAASRSPASAPRRSTPPRPRTRWSGKPLDRGRPSSSRPPRAAEAAQPRTDHRGQRGLQAARRGDVRAPRS